MGKIKLLFVTVAVASFLSADFASAEDVPRGGGGFLIGRIAAKKIKKMREQENFSGADQNKDGKLDKQELESAKKTHGDFIDDATFKKIDANGDGVLSHDECEKFQKETEKAESGAKTNAKPDISKDKGVKTEK
ncbi:MAG: EF-hand domain-containing protein [Lentisphaerota bacterium]